MFQDLKAVLSRARASLRRRGASQHEAEDWTQEAWLRMSQSLDGREVPNPEGYLIRTAINIAIDEYRARRLRGSEVDIEDVAVLVADPAPGQDVELLGKERLQRLWKCMDRLPERTRAIFLAHRLGERTFGDIGREFGISDTVVGEHVARATARLTTWMEGW
jgi:RNA polymerase sigma-70 factor (ECF subfamily)